jgi:hypothetical protein
MILPGTKPGTRGKMAMSKTFGERLAENYAATGRLMSAVYKNISDDHWYPIFQAGKLVAKTAYRTWRKVRSPIEDAMGASFFRETLDRKIVLYDPRRKTIDSQLGYGALRRLTFEE